MATVRFEDGTVVNFEGDPTPEDIEEVANTLSLQKKEPGFIQGVAQSIAKPFLQAGVTAGTALTGIQRNIEGRKPPTYEESTINFGPFGEVGPFETQGKAFLGGIEAGSSFTPTGKGVKVIGGTLQTTGNVVKGLGEQAVEAVIPLSKAEAGKLQVYRADNPITKRIVEFFIGKSTKPQITAKTTIEKGLLGTESMIGVGALRKSRELWKNKIAPAVSKIKEKLNRDDLFSEILDDIGKISDPTTQASRMKAFSAILDDYKHLPEMDYTKAQQIKSELQRVLPAKTWRGEDITGEYNNIRKLISDKIAKKTYEKLKDVNIKKDYLDYGNLKNLQELGKSDMTGSKLKGGAGSFAYGLLERAAIPIGTIGGQILYKSGDIIFQAGKGIKKLGDYLDILSLSKIGKK